MAHFAELDNNNTVIRVIVFDTVDGPEGETAIADWIGGGTWKQTSYNSRIRGVYAGIGYSYDPDLDVFVVPSDV